MRKVGVQFVIAQVDLGTDGTNPASISVNDTATDSNSLRKTKLAGSLLAEGTNAFACASKVPVLKICC